jgi:hypothetical protein
MTRGGSPAVLLPHGLPALGQTQHRKRMELLKRKIEGQT